MRRPNGSSHHGNQAHQPILSYNEEQVYLEEIGNELLMNVYFWYDRDGSNNYPAFEVGPFSTAAENTVLKIQHQLVTMDDYNDVLFIIERRAHSLGLNSSKGRSRVHQLW